MNIFFEEAEPTSHDLACEPSSAAPSIISLFPSAPSGAPSDPETAPYYVGTRARLVPLENGIAIEVSDDAGTWIRQVEYTEN